MAVSQNGWTASPEAGNYVPFRWVTGRLAPAVVPIFEHLCSRFDAEVEPIVQSHSWGWAYRAIRGASRLSNHASGTAIDLNAPAHPLGKSGTFSATQVETIKSILDDCAGLVRWGGTYSGRKDEMHFEIVGTPVQVAAWRPPSKEDDMTPEEAALLAQVAVDVREIKQCLGIRKNMTGMSERPLSTNMAARLDWMFEQHRASSLDKHIEDLAAGLAESVVAAIKDRGPDIVTQDMLNEAIRTVLGSLDED